MSKILSYAAAAASPDAPKQTTKNKPLKSEKSTCSFRSVVKTASTGLVAPTPKGTAPKAPKFSPSPEEVAKLSRGFLPSVLLAKQISSCVGAFRRNNGLTGSKPLNKQQFSYCKASAKAALHSLFRHWSASQASTRVNLAVQAARKAQPTQKVVVTSTDEALKQQLVEANLKAESLGTLKVRLDSRVSTLEKVVADLTAELAALRAKPAPIPVPAAAPVVPTYLTKDALKGTSYDFPCSFKELRNTTIDSYPKGRIDLRLAATHVDFVAVPRDGDEFILARLSKTGKVVNSASINPTRRWALIFFQEYMGPGLKDAW